MSELIELFITFFKIGILGFGGGYGMLSLIMAESRRFHVSIEQFADLNVLDMVVPGPIAINAATYVGYLDQGLPGSVLATAGVILPSFILVALVMRFFDRYRENRLIGGFWEGLKPAAVGLVAAAAVTIALGVLAPDADISQIFSDPLGSISLISLAIFSVAALLNIRFDANPILLTLIGGVIGALFIR